MIGAGGEGGALGVGRGKRGKTGKRGKRGKRGKSKPPMTRVAPNIERLACEIVDQATSIENLKMKIVVQPIGK